MIPSIYINLEDDVTKIAARIKKERASELVLVCPKRCFLFNDSINLRLLKKQVDMYQKKVSILTMDERGQVYAREAGFELKNLPKALKRGGLSDIAPRSKDTTQPPVLPKSQPKSSPIIKAISEPKDLGNKLEPDESEFASQSIFSDQADQISGSGSPVASSQSVFPKELEDNYKQNKLKKRTSKLFTSFIFIAFFAAAAVVFLVLPKAVISIYPKTQGLTRDLEISAQAQATSPDPQRLVFPASFVTQAVSAQAKFQSQGKKEVGNQASGSVVIYNFTGAPINLRAKTTTLSLNGKNYTLQQDVLQLKPTRYKNAKTKEVDESSLAAPVDVQAALGGEGYNVPAGTRIEITNQVFGSKPQLLYAKATIAITGGTSRYLSYITADDMTQAKAQLQRQAVANLTSQMKSQNLVLDEKAVVLQNLQFTFDREVGTETPEFSGQVAAQASILAYDQAQLKQLVLSRISQSLAPSEKVQVKLSSPLGVSVKSFDAASQNMVLEVHFDGAAVADTSSARGISSQLRAKSQAAAASLIKSLVDVDKVEITLTPGWQTWLPLIEKNIKIEIKS